jgi:hypothetical protein
MRVEKVFDKKYMPYSQRRPSGRSVKASTKRGNKKRGLRARLVSLLDEVSESEDDEEEEN